MNKRHISTALTCAILLSLHCSGVWAADITTGSGNGVAIGTGSSAPKAENVAIGKDAKILYSNGKVRQPGTSSLGPKRIPTTM